MDLLLVLLERRDLRFGQRVVFQKPAVLLRELGVLCLKRANLQNGRMMVAVNK